jgi:hypothetical protein
MAGNLVEGIGQVGGQLVQQKLGGTFAGKLAGAATETAAVMVANEVREPRIQLEDGLKTDVYRIVTSKPDAILSGTIKTSSKDEETTQKEEVKDKDGNVVRDSAGKAVTVEIPCLRRTVTSELRWSLKPPNGEALAGRTVSATRVDEKCQEERKNVASAATMAKSAVTGMGAAIVAEIKPAWKVLRLPVERGPSVRDIIQMINRSEPERALCYAEQLHKLDPADAEMALARAALKEALGDLKGASEAYADVLTVDAKSRPARKGQERVAERQTEIATLERAHKLKWSPKAPDLNSCPRLPDGRPAILKKDTLLASSPGGKTGQELERGQRVFVVGEEGAVLKVSTVEGQVGFLPASNLK